MAALVKVGKRFFTWHHVLHARTSYYRYWSSEPTLQWSKFCIHMENIQLFRWRLSEKVHATIPKGIVGGFEFTVLQRNLKEWHHIIAYIVPGHVDVPDVLILLLGWQLEKIFTSQGFFLRTVIVIVAKLTLFAVISSKVLIAFALFVIKSWRSVMALVVFLERLVMTELEHPITNDHFLSCTSVSIATAWCTKSFWDWTTFLVFHIRQKCTNSRKLTFSLE